MAHVLEGAELDVAGAATIAEAERLRDAAPAPDGIVLDLRLPDGHGLSLAERCRSDPRTADCAIVACTAGDHPDELRRAFECGCDAYVTKPIDPGRFAELITSLIAERAVAGDRGAWTRAGDQRGVWVRTGARDAQAGGVCARA